MIPSSSLVLRNRITSACTIVTSCKSKIMRSLLAFVCAFNSSRSSDRIRPISQMMVVFPSDCLSIFNGACASSGCVQSMFRRCTDMHSGRHSKSLGEQGVNLILRAVFSAKCGALNKTSREALDSNRFPRGRRPGLGPKDRGRRSIS